MSSKLKKMFKSDWCSRQNSFKNVDAFNKIWEAGHTDKQMIPDLYQHEQLIPNLHQNRARSSRFLTYKCPYLNTRWEYKCRSS
jgi:hypothetical protein